MHKGSPTLLSIVAGVYDSYLVNLLCCIWILVVILSCVTPHGYLRCSGFVCHLVADCVSDQTLHERIVIVTSADIDGTLYMLLGLPSDAHIAQIIAIHSLDAHPHFRILSSRACRM